MQTLKKRIIASHIKIKTKMKVKNLLLAGLAVAAMTACSNDEIIDNDGIQTNGENAAMQINFQFPLAFLKKDIALPYNSCSAYSIPIWLYNLPQNS